MPIYVGHRDTWGPVVNSFFILLCNTPHCGQVASHGRRQWTRAEDDLSAGSLQVLASCKGVGSYWKEMVLLVLIVVVAVVGGGGGGGHLFPVTRLTNIEEHEA